MSEAVTCSMTGDIAVVTIDSPPVNAIDRFIRAGLKQVFAELAARRGVKAVVLGCKGKTFVAGADIKEFDAGTIGLDAICRRILEFRRTLDPRYWTPAPLLEELALTGSSFAQWQAVQAR